MIIGTQEGTRILTATHVSYAIPALAQLNARNPSSSPHTRSLELIGSGVEGQTLEPNPKDEGIVATPTRIVMTL